MKQTQSRIRRGIDFVKRHRAWSVIGLLVIVFGGYYIYGKLYPTVTPTRYVLSTVSKGTVIATVTGTGQVSASNQVDVKPKVSGDVDWIGVVAGQMVVAGQALASLDDTTAAQSLTSAELDLKATKLNYDQSTAQAPVDFSRQIDAVASAKASVANEYDSAFASISTVYLNLPTTMTGIQDVLYGTTLSKQLQSNIDYYENLFSDPNNSNYPIIMGLATIAIRDYQTALAAYNTSFLDFQKLTRSSSQSDIEQVLNETLVATKAVAQAAKSEKNLIDTIVTTMTNLNRSVNSVVTSTYVPNLATYISAVNSNVNSLSNEVTTLGNAKTAVITAEQNLSIMKIGNPSGDNPISLQVASNTIAQKEQNIVALKNTLANYVIRAPFDGVVAKVNIKKGDSVSSGTAVVTLITHQKIAVISLNEVDIAKIQIGQKVNLTFDAIEGLSITGEVSAIDTIGTVSQNVVSYSAQVSFDTQDERIKPGMTTNVSIQTAVRPDVLVVPASAVKTTGTNSVVQVVEPAVTYTSGTTGIVLVTAPQSVSVEIGLSDDTNVEIISGLKEGQQVVSRTVSGSATVKTATSGATNRTGLGGIRL